MIVTYNKMDDSQRHTQKKAEDKQHKMCIGQIYCIPDLGNK